MTLLHRPSTHWNKSMTRLTITFYETVHAYFLSPTFDNALKKKFFCTQARWKISSVLKPTRITTLLHRHSIHLNKSLTRLIITFYETAQAYYLSPNFDNVLSTFYVGHLDQ